MRSLPAVGDLDGDADVLAAERTAFFYFENTAGPNAAPMFLARTTNPFGLAPASNSPVPAVADLDADGDLDLLAGESIGNLYVFENVATVAAETGPDASAVSAPWPNPTAAAARLTVGDAPAERGVRILDALGRTVQRRRVLGTEVLLDVSGLASGVYAVCVESADGVAVRRLAVAR